MQQQKALFITNLVFGTLSVIMMWVGYKVVNEAAVADDRVSILICAEGDIWVSNGVWGSVFTAIIQMLILLQINASQFVLIRTPDNMGCFEKQTLSKKMGNQLRARLLNQELSKTLELKENQLER